MSGTYSLGLDIGGTFTDVVLYSNERGTVFSHKELTTADEPTEGALRGIEILLEREQITSAQVSRVVHATTLFTNALIQRKGVKTGLITTRGFRDTLEMRREHKYDLYDLFLELPSPLVPRELRFEADERIRANGTVDVALNEQSVTEAAGRLVAAGVKAIAICFLHAYANPEHEKQARAVIEKHYPEVFVSISSEVSPQIREYERTSTTVANAYVQPIADRYLAQMDEGLKKLGIGCGLQMMLSNGGLTHVGEARRFPVQLLESGPAGGAIVAAYFSGRSGIDDVLAFDLGGTTAKLAIVEGNQPLISYKFEAGRQKRFAPGSGLPVNISTVELIEIGAGGGSIARVDDLQLLKVGPNSAGSKPGPACYQRGGIEPTVTDANLIVGRLDPNTFAGGTMQLSMEAAQKSLLGLAAGLDLEPHKVADGVLAVVNENMAAAARVHVAERGFDASHFALLVTGGGGPLHGCDLAARLGIKRVICPPGAGVASALGLLIAPARIDRSITFARQLGAVTYRDLENAYAKLEADAAGVMRKTLPEGTKFNFERAADIRFVGQGFEVVTRVPNGPFNEGTHEEIEAAFSSAYGRIFGRVPPAQSVELVNLRVTAVEAAVDRPLNLENGRDSWRSAGGQRQLRLADGTLALAPVMPRGDLLPGKSLSGPLIIEDSSSTLIVPPSASVHCDAAGNLIVDL